MNHLLRPRIWASFLASSSVGPSTYRSGTPRIQLPAVARWHAHLCGLATATHEISGLIIQYRLPASAKRHKTPGSCFAPSETQEPCPVMNLNPEIRFILLTFISRRAMSAQALPKKLVYSTWDLRCQLCGWSKRQIGFFRFQRTATNRKCRSTSTAKLS